MTDYDFTLKFDLKDPDLDPAIYVESLYENGCDDALIGIGKKGYIVLNFIREDSSPLKAISQAIAKIEKVIPFASLVEATLDIAGDSIPLNIKPTGKNKQKELEILKINVIH